VKLLKKRFSPTFHRCASAARFPAPVVARRRRRLSSF
jgi:hypothetical protein